MCFHSCSYIGFTGGSAMSLTAHCLLVENKNKHEYFMENLKVIGICFGLPVVIDDLYQNDEGQWLH